VATGDARALEVFVDSTRPDLGLVDALARLELVARRRGWTIRWHTGDELRGLLLLVGLAEVLTLEPRRKTEERIQLGIEEVVQPGDPPI
jgi:hypothetical protein